MRSNPLLSGLRPTHPGELLREDVLPALGRANVEIAALLGVSIEQLEAILGELEPITASIAEGLSQLAGPGPDVWLAIQQAYDASR